MDSGIISMSPFREGEKKANNQQIEWINEHFKYLDEGQKEFVEFLIGME